MIDPTSTYTPSEIVYFHGDKFAPENGLSRTEILLCDKKVNTGKLAETMLAAAILANESAGVIRLAPVSKKGFLGIGSKTVLGIQLVQPAAWPETSLEAELYGIVYKQYARQPVSVYDFVYNLWDMDKTNPWSEVVALARWALVRRKLLISDEKRTLKIFVSYDFSIPDERRAEISQLSTGMVQQLLSSASMVPDKWKMLTKEISSALHARQEKSDTDFD